MKKQAFCIFAVLGALSLSGCGAGDTLFGSGTSLSQDASSNPSASMAEKLNNPQPQQSEKVSSTDPQVSDIICPKVEIRPGTETMRSFETGSPGAPADLKWQATISTTARECSILGAEVGFKVGVSGRVLLGPKGQPGTYTVPVRIAVAKNGTEPLWSHVNNVQVTIPAGEASAPFVYVVEDILFPRDANDNLGNVQIFAGFDPNAPPEKKGAAKKGKRKQ